MPSESDVLPMRALIGAIGFAIVKLSSSYSVHLRKLGDNRWEWRVVTPLRDLAGGVEPDIFAALEAAKEKAIALK